MTNIGRRAFTRGALAATALSRSRILGANERVRLGLISADDRGMQMWKRFLDLPNVQAVAISDVELF
jgi:hypothetical protein